MTPRNWRRRWFVIRDDCIAYYYSSPDVSHSYGLALSGNVVLSNTLSLFVFLLVNNSLK